MKQPMNAPPSELRRLKSSESLDAFTETCTQKHQMMPHQAVSQAGLQACAAAAPPGYKHQPKGATSDLLDLLDLLL